VFPDLFTINDSTASNGKRMYEAVCPDCGAMVMKLSSAADRDLIDDRRNPNTSRDRLHEDCGAVPACIWIAAIWLLHRRARQTIE